MSRLRFFLIAAVAGLLALMSASGSFAMSEREGELRQKLGIPEQARQVIIFAQSSHWDPDWLLTADQYQKLLTDRAIANALVELKKDPAYVYSVECIFFFKRFFDSHPDKQAGLIDYANQGRIRFTGGGVTTPDTLLPEPENLIRDYLVGREWLRKVGIKTDPRLAYLPDCFGHSPSWPSILREMGYKYTAFARLDGMYAFGTDFRLPRDFPTPGSSAEILLREKTLDFVWQGPDGSQVLAHWEIAMYSQGDNIARTFPGIFMSLPAGLPTPLPFQTNARIDSYIKTLAPYSRTGYMFCPVGGDFMSPIPNLGRYMRTYNEMRYKQTGTYAVLAGLEDYMELVECRKEQLPVLTLDLNPLFMGFYSSRPELKQYARSLTQSLVLTEWLGSLAEISGKDAFPILSEPWYSALFSDHHDYITGTGRQPVYETEQLPVLKLAQAQVDSLLIGIKKLFSPEKSIGPAPIKWSQERGLITVENDFYRIELEEKSGGCITKWYDKTTGQETLAGPSNDLVLYADSGGLWRMGQELLRGKFKALDRSSKHPAQLSARMENNVLAVSAELKMEKRGVVKTVYFRSDSPAVRLKIKGSVGAKRTATVAFKPALKPGRFVQEVTYGVVERPIKKNYDPTFWAVKNWVDLYDASGKSGVNLALSAPAAVAARECGQVELIVLRNTPEEKIGGIIVPSFPASEKDFDEHVVDYGFWPHGPEDWRTRGVFITARDLLDDSWLDPQKPDWPAFAASMVKTDSREVVVTSVKKTEDGKGYAVRLMSYAGARVTVNLAMPSAPKQAFLATGLETRLTELPIRDGKIELTMPYVLATVVVVY